MHGLYNQRVQMPMVDPPHATRGTYYYGTFGNLHSSTHVTYYTWYTLHIESEIDTI